MSYFTLARDIRYKISQGKLEEAINLLQKALADHPDFWDEVVLTSATYQTLSQQIRTGTISQEDLDVGQQKLFRTLLEIADQLEAKETQSTRIFLSYSNRSPDNALAMEFHDSLEKEGFAVFMAEKDIALGENKLNRIHQELIASDFFILLISERSNESDLVLKEVKIAKYLQGAHSEAKPRILPIRIQLDSSYSLNYDLAGYLEGIQQAKWESEQHTSSILESIINAIKSPVPSKAIDLDLLPVVEEKKTIKITERKMEGSEDTPLPKPLPKAPLESPFGTVSPDSVYYIERAGEPQFLQALSQKGAVMRVKGPRQFGKTSLLSRLIDKGRTDGYQVSSWSMQFVETLTLTDLDMLLKSMCVHIATELGLEKKKTRQIIKEIWEDDLLDSKMKCTSFFQEYLFDQIDGVFFLAMDEADRVFGYEHVSNDFFGLLRSWHDRVNSHSAWERFRLAVSYSTEIHLAIRNMDQSPFNVGLEAKLDVFTREEVEELIQRHKLSLKTAQVSSLMELLGGHPFLVRKALYDLAIEEYSFNDLIAHATDDEGPFRDHLKRHLWNLNQQPECIDVMKNILKKGSCIKAALCDKLRSAGLIKGSFPDFELSFGLYQQYLAERLASM